MMCFTGQMPQAIRFLVALVVGLALLTGVAAVGVHRMTRRWFENDVALRAQLAVNGARQALLRNLEGRDRRGLTSLMEDMARDEWVLGVAFCGNDLGQLAQSQNYPRTLPCADLAARVRGPEGTMVRWRSVLDLAGGKVHVSAIPVEGRGFITLVHDWAHIQDREDNARRYLFVGFGLLAAVAAAITLVAARLSRRRWREDLRRFLRGGPERPERSEEFQPILSDVRELVERLSVEKETEGGGGVWNAQRLKRVLNRHLHGEQVVVVANREPYIHEKVAGGKVEVLHPGQRPGHRARAGDAGLLGHLDRPRQRLAPTGRRSTATTACGCRPASESYACGGSG